MSFTQQIGSYSRRTQAKLQRIRRGVLLKLFNAVVLDTPVLTGRLRANWRFQEHAPELNEIDREDKSGAIVLAEIAAGVAQSTGHFDIYLTNNLPYAHRIEFDGWSHTKAPEGMVRKNVVRFARIIKVEAAKS